MGRQIRFYAVHRDFRALLRVAEEGGLVALPRVVATAAYDRRGYTDPVPPLTFPRGTESQAFYLVPAAVPPVEVFYHEFRADSARSYLASHVSPVIEVVPGRRAGDALYHGRLYINAPRQGPGADLVHRAYDRLARHVRGWHPVASGVHAGPMTWERVTYGEIRLEVVGGRPLPVDEYATRSREVGPRIEWIEIPGGPFVHGLTDEQREDLAQRLYSGYGIGALPPDLQAWIEATRDKPKSSYSPAEEEIWRREVLRSASPALAYQHALWALSRIPAARHRFLPTVYVARFPITRAQAALFYASPVAQAMGWDPPRYPDEGVEGGDRPALMAWWEQAQALAHWLGGRLPTPWEWEKAARGTEGWLYPWGNTWNPAAGHFRTSKAGGGSAGKRKGLVTAVDAYPAGASPYGLLDVVGNLAEWHALTSQNEVGWMGFSFKEMPATNPWFYALPMHRRGGTRRQPSRYVGCRPVLEEWGRRLWPGYRVSLE